MDTKIINTIFLSSLIGSLLFLGSGCSKKSLPPLEESSSSTLEGGTNITYPPAETGGYSEATLATEGTLDDTGSVKEGEMTGNLSVNASQQEPTEAYLKEHGRSSLGFSPIYFDFDQAGIRADMVDTMISNAEFIQQLPNPTSVVIEGNCDDRGTNEYNLALGERRAINAKEYLVDLGIDAGKIRTVSYGEERPLFTNQDETAWSQNRRDDFIIE